MPVSPESSSSDLTVERDAALARLAALPQAAHLPPETRRQWLDHQLERLREESAGSAGRGSSLALDRQIERLSGFGASEIGVLVGERRGEYSPFATAREICAAKLLRALPAPPTGPMQRGVELEPHARRLFLRHSGARPLPDLLQAVVAHRPRDHGWLLATPDDLVMLNGRTLVVDYKAPAEPPTAVSLEHACQLHQAALVAEDRGIRIEGLVLVALNLREWTVDTFLVDRDPALDAEILAAGQHYWRDWVLQGELPPWPQRDAASRALALADLSPAAKAELERAALGYVRLDILAKQARELAARARDQLAGLAAEHGLRESVLVAPVNLSRASTWDAAAIAARLPDPAPPELTRPKWDAEMLARQVRALGGDPTPALLDRALDLDQAADWLIAHHHVPAESLQRIEYTVAVSRRKPDQVLTEPVRDAARTAAHAFAAPGP